MNWRAQHPPLHDALLAPTYRPTMEWSFGTQMLPLRSLTYALAWAGLVLSVRAALPKTGARRLPATPPLLGMAAPSHRTP